MSFDHVMEIAFICTITLLYIYFCIWELDLKLNSINFHYSLFFIICIDLNHHYHYYQTSKLLLNLWEYTQGLDITNKWVVYFVILSIIEFIQKNSIKFFKYKVFTLYILVLVVCVILYLTYSKNYILYNITVLKYSLLFYMMYDYVTITMIYVTVHNNYFITIYMQTETILYTWRSKNCQNYER